MPRLLLLIVVYFVIDFRVRRPPTGLALLTSLTVCSCSLDILGRTLVRRYADVIVPNGASNKVAIDMIVNEIRAKIR